MSEFVNPFEAVDIADIPSDPLGVEPGTYEAVISEAYVRPTQNGDKTGLTIKYEIPDIGRKTVEWKQLPTLGVGETRTPDQTRQMSFVKQRLLQCGLTESDLAGNWPDLLVGREVLIKIERSSWTDKVTKEKRSGTNITQVQVKE